MIPKSGNRFSDKIMRMKNYCEGVLILTCLTTAAGSTSR
jgi:hypothetical protein